MKQINEDELKSLWREVFMVRINQSSNNTITAQTDADAAVEAYKRKFEEKSKS